MADSAVHASESQVAITPPAEGQAHDTVLRARWARSPTAVPGYSAAIRKRCHKTVEPDTRPDRRRIENVLDKRQELPRSRSTLVRCRRGRVCRGSRPQWVRQDHADADGRRLGQAVGRAHPHRWANRQPTLYRSGYRIPERSVARLARRRRQHRPAGRGTWPQPVHGTTAKRRSTASRWPGWESRPGMCSPSGWSWPDS